MESGWSTSHPGRFNSEMEPPISMSRMLRFTQNMFGRGGERQLSASTRNRTPTLRLSSPQPNPYTDWSTLPFSEEQNYYPDILIWPFLTEWAVGSAESINWDRNCRRSIGYNRTLITGRHRMSLHLQCNWKHCPATSDCNSRFYCAIQRQVLKSRPVKIMKLLVAVSNVFGR
jgi:hypothetical protein